MVVRVIVESWKESILNTWQSTIWNMPPLAATEYVELKPFQRFADEHK